MVSMKPATKARLTVWGSAVTLISFLCLVSAAVTPYIDDRLGSGGIEIATAFYFQELVVLLSLSVIAIASLASRRIGKPNFDQVGFCVGWFTVVFVMLSCLWLIYEAPRRMDPPGSPGADFGAGIITVLVGVAAPFVILISYRIVERVKPRIGRRDPER